MSKRKILMLAVSVCMVAILAMGGTLAYFTDIDKADNVFTTGNVSIELNENFGDNNPETPEKLMPATGSAQNGTLKNGITKEVSVINDGTEPVYARVHIAIPSCLDNGNPEFDAGKNTLHFNFQPDSIGAGKWNWSKSLGEPYTGDWNYYETTIDGKNYNVYVVTYEDVIPAPVGSTYYCTEKVIHQVYLDQNASQEAIKGYIDELGENWHILVVAEGTQAVGFDNAYDALNTSFGVPGSYTVDFSGAAQG